MGKGKNRRISPKEAERRRVQSDQAVNQRHQAPPERTHGIGFYLKEFSPLVLSTALGLASLTTSDAWVVIPMLSISAVAVIVLLWAAYRALPLWTKVLIGTVVSGTMLFIGVRALGWYRARFAIVHESSSLISNPNEFTGILIETGNKHAALIQVALFVRIINKQSVHTEIDRISVDIRTALGGCH